MSPSNQHSRLSPKQRLDRYTIQSMIGKGENAEVYRAFHPDYKRDVAIKVFHPDITRSESLTPIFKDQAREIIGLKHPNITRIFEAGIVDDSYYLVMELIEGTSLRDEVSMHPTGFEREEAMRLFRQIASAVAYAHEQGIMHGNIKPDNVLLDRTHRPILTDFNIPCFREHPSGRGGAATPIYLSPEQVTDRHTVTKQTDIYALGILLYEIVTGDVPFKGGSPSEIARQQLQADPPSPSKTNIGLDPRIENTIMGALKKDPVERFESVRNMLVALESDIASNSYETVSLTREAVAEARKSRSEIRRFERSRTAPSETVDTAEPGLLESRALVIGLAGAALVIFLVLALALLL